MLSWVRLSLVSCCLAVAVSEVSAGKEINRSYFIQRVSTRAWDALQMGLRQLFYLLPAWSAALLRGPAWSLRWQQLAGSAT